MLRGTTTLTWTPDRVEHCFAMWKDGLSAGLIAEKRGGVSRSSVIGRVHRAGLARSSPILTMRVPSAPKVKSQLRKPPRPGPQCRPAVHHGVNFGAMSKEDEARARAGRKVTADAALARAASKIVESPDALPFLEAKHGCKWPIGEGMTMLFCCNPKARGSYCEGHANVAYSSVGYRTDVTSDKAARHLTRYDRVAA